MKKRERNMFFAIATYAIDNGCRVSLERENSTYYSETLNGVLAHTDNKNKGLILRVKPPKESEGDE